jgi:hypothetical protein
MINSETIRKVMLETGMDYLQARNHLVARRLVESRIARERVPQLGRNCYLPVDSITQVR